MTRIERYAPAKAAVTPVSLALACFALLLAGCGGGGGGGSRSTSIRLVTNWSGGSGGVTGQSERITILDAAGTKHSQQTINAQSTPSTTALPVPSGAYTVRVELNSAPNFGGSVTGVSETTVVSGATSLNYSVGVAPTALRLTPSSANISVGESLRLGVSGIVAGGALTFLPPSSVTFAKTGTAVSVDAAGVVKGLASGTSTVTAQGPNGLTADATINVSLAGVTRSKWTVLVYLNAANTLYPYATPNVNQMERVAFNKDVRFVLQWKESGALFGQQNVHHDGTRRYLVKPDSGSDTSAIKSELVEDMGTHVDMGKAATLRDFITWGKEHYPADRYVVVIWNHGNGWQRSRLSAPPVRAVSYDDEYNSYIDIWDLPTAFSGQRVDAISFDACLMQMLEVASDLKTSADFIAASEENTPGPGYPYDRVFKGFADDPNRDTRTLTKSFVDGHVTYDLYKNLPITQSVVDTAKVNGVESAVDELAGALIAARDAIATAIPTIRSGLRKYADPNDGRYYYDLVDLCNALRASADIPSPVKSAAANVIAAVGIPGSTDAVVWNGFTTKSNFSHGIAIDFSPASSTRLRYYGNLNLAKVTRWDDWLAIAP